MEFSNAIEIERKTCYSCSRVLLSPEPAVDNEASLSAERLTQLLSNAGLDVYVPRSTFHEAVQSGCTICKALNDIAETRTFDDLLSKYCLRASSMELAPSHEFGDKQLDTAQLQDEVLVINFHADTIPVSHIIPGHEQEQSQPSSPFDIKEIQVSPLGAHERWNTSISFDILATACRSPFHILGS